MSSSRSTRISRTAQSEVGLQSGKHREDEVPERGVLGDEEAGGVDVSVLQGGLLLGGDVLLLRAVPRLLQAAPARERDVGSGAVHGLALHQPPLLLVQFRQDGHSGFVLEALPGRVGGHYGLITNQRTELKRIKLPLGVLIRGI